MNTAIIHCDGSFNRHNGIGGYGVTIQLGVKIIEFSEKCEGITSSARAEMLGAIRAIEVCSHKSDRIQVYTDNQPLVHSMNKFLQLWIKSGEINNKPNKDLWLRLNSLCKQVIVEWFWVRGHNGDHWNERADTLAKEAVLGSTW